MDKQGITQETLIRLILLVIGIAMIFVLFVRLSAVTNEDAEKRLCTATLAAQTFTKIGDANTPLHTDSPLKTKCERRFLEVQETNVRKVRSRGIDVQIPVWIEGKPETTFQTMTDDIMNSILAESMRRCWETGLEGEKALFNDESLVGKEVSCLICDQIDIEVLGSYGASSPLSDYLAATTMPLDDRERTYEEYLFTPKSLRSELFGGDPSYAVVTGSTDCLTDTRIEENPVLERGTYSTILFRDFSKVQGGCMATYVVPSSKVRTLCENTVN